MRVAGSLTIGKSRNVIQFGSALVCCRASGLCNSAGQSIFKVSGSGKWSGSPSRLRIRSKLFLNLKGSNFGRVNVVDLTLWILV